MRWKGCIATIFHERRDRLRKYAWQIIPFIRVWTLTTGVQYTIIKLINQISIDNLCYIFWFCLRPLPVILIIIIWFESHSDSQMFHEMSVISQLPYIKVKDSANYFIPDSAATCAFLLILNDGNCPGCVLHKRDTLSSCLIYFFLFFCDLYFRLLHLSYCSYPKR